MTMAQLCKAVILALSVLNLPTKVLAELPAYSGQYGVGTVVVEVPAANPRSITNLVLKSNQQPAFKLDTVLMNIYYPINKSTTSTKPQHQWLSVPGQLIAQGLSNSLGGSISPELINIGFGIFAANLSIPAQVDVALLPTSAQATFPVMIFSHGQPTMSDWYSQYYGEMASRGTVIVAVTHRDGSSPATIVMFQNGTSYNITAFTQDAVLPQMNSTDFNQMQLEMRQAEFEEVTRTLSSIATGNGGQVYNSSSRGEGQDLANWKGRLDLSQLIIAGHSFGSNAVFRYLRDQTPLVPAAAALPFDPGKDSGPITNETVTVPLLIPDSEEWSGVPTEFYGQQHFNVVKGIAQAGLNSTGAAWFMTLLGTVHTSISDVGIIAASFAQFFTNQTQFIQLDPKTAILQYVNVSDDFVTYVKSKSITNLLATNVTYPNFQLLPNASTLSDPWEVHVAPTVPANNNTGNSTKKSAAAAGATLNYSILASCLLFGTMQYVFCNLL